MIIKTPAKINLCLDIIGKRDDGYHELDMIMHEIPLYDTVTVEKNDNISISMNVNNVLCDESNIAYIAAKGFFDYTGIKGGAKIHIEKNIPSGAGLGGGSSDGAAVIRLLDIIYDTLLTSEQMKEIALKVGADVPFFIEGECCIAQGIGEKLTPLPLLPPCYILLAKPDFSISTKWAYEKVDSIEFSKHCKTSEIAEALLNQDIYSIGKNMFNVFEYAIDNPQIKQIKHSMISNGAIGSIMSGSGSCVFGLFDDYEKAEYCKNKIKDMDLLLILGNL